jgi:uncharacterized protein YgbK (DUF1537 family)
VTTLRAERAPAPRRALDRPLVVLDDDPTGAQLLAGVRVLLEWDADRIGDALAERPAVHLLTNSRALAPGEARALVAEATGHATAGAPDAVVVLRGDSTLRGHLLEEYLGVAGGQPSPLLLVPALPSAGRVTVDGVHLIERGGDRTPLHLTEYATDGGFAYRSARLLEWAEERSNGFFRARDGIELGRLDRQEPLADALDALARRGRPAVCAPDAETSSDLEIVAAGLAQALERDVPVVVRCAPAFAGVLSGCAATDLVPAPAARRVLVVCGSHVPTTTAQLERLEARRPGTLLEADLDALASDSPAEPERLAIAASRLLAEHGLAVVATPRRRADLSLEHGRAAARSLARVLPLVDPQPDVVVAKGGITSAVTLRDGVGATEAEVVGPLLPGVSHWRAAGRDYVVVPGNVGTAELLADLADLLLDGAR